MRLARADILVLQSDDVRHVSPACERLAAIEPGTFNIATVYNVVPGVCVGMMYTGPQNRRPLFFLGSVRRSDICAVGGNDEEFVRPGWEDDWLAACLTRGRGLRPVYRADVTGYHQDHPRPDLGADYAAGRALYEAKARAAETGAGPWTAAAGPWPEPINTSAYVPVTI